MGVRKVLFCSHTVEWGGAEMVLVDLFQVLDRKHFEPHLACPGPGPLPARAGQLGVTTHTMPIGGSSPMAKAIGLPRAARHLRALAKRLGARLLYANTMIAGYAGVLAQRRELPCLWHLHIVTHSRIARCAVRRAAAVITPSRAGARAVAPRLQDGRCTVVPNGVAPQFFAATGDGLRQELGLAAGTPLIGIVGRIDPHKGHAVLIEAMAALPGPHLVIAGGESFADSQARIGGYTEQLRALAAGLEGRVHFLGHRSDTAALMAQLDVVVVPSIALESAPRAIAEAQAAGRAVIGSDIGGIAEMIAPGATGLLVAPGDARALSGALQTLLTDPGARARLGAAARDHALAEYSLERFGQRIAEVCERLCRSS